MKKYDIAHSELTNCYYIMCDGKKVAECTEQIANIRAGAIAECMTILKSHHMFRTCEDDYNQKIERPFYQNLWNRFEQLKEQNND